MAGRAMSAAPHNGRLDYCQTPLGGHGYLVYGLSAFQEGGRFSKNAALPSVDSPAA